MIKGIFSKEIYRFEKGYIIGLLKIKEIDIEDLEYYINKSIILQEHLLNLLNDMHEIISKNPTDIDIISNYISKLVLINSLT